MWSLLLRLFGRRVIHTAVARKTTGTGLDFRFGLSLMRDKRIPAKFKIGAVLLAFLGMALLNILEVPGETIVAVALPVVGIPIDIAFNGLENILGPLLLTGLALPMLAPKMMVQQIRREASGDVVDVEFSEVRPAA